MWWIVSAIHTKLISTFLNAVFTSHATVLSLIFWSDWMVQVKPCFGGIQTNHLSSIHLVLKPLDKKIVLFLFVIMFVLFLYLFYFYICFIFIFVLFLYLFYFYICFIFIFVLFLYLFLYLFILIFNFCWIGPSSETCACRSVGTDRL